MQQKNTEMRREESPAETQDVVRQSELRDFAEVFIAMENLQMNIALRLRRGARVEPGPFRSVDESILPRLEMLEELAPSYPRCVSEGGRAGFCELAVEWDALDAERTEAELAAMPA